jgi:hypothetical protein
MTQQEIKANLPKLPLIADFVYGCVIDSQSSRILSTETQDYEIETDIAVDFAIVHAINNTYGKGINPESVPDMFNALTLIEKDLRALNMVEIANKVQDILKNATL